MRESDFEAFSTMLDAVCSLLSRGTYVPNGTNTSLWFRSLAAHDIEAVRAGFDAHVKDGQRGRFVPTPADILAQIAGTAADDGRPGAEEAWAIAIHARDELETVVWTAETAVAWQVAREVLELGDEVGARMAFREAYGRLVTAARENRIAVVWQVSYGHDVKRRVVALEAAASLGRISRRLALECAAQALQPQLALVHDANGSNPARELALTALRELGQRMRARSSEVRIDMTEHQRTEALKAAAGQKVADYLGSGEHRKPEDMQGAA